ncbi:MAG: hypothetical protein OXU21_14435 [Chloroflexota bacterium]|nr:hypothetical protein [Chloroflexota bacterium]
MAGRSSIELLPLPLLALVHEAIAEGATIIRAEVEGEWHGWTPETHDEGAHRLDIHSYPMRRSGPS